METPLLRKNIDTATCTMLSVIADCSLNGLLDVGSVDVKLLEFELNSLPVITQPSLIGRQMLVDCFTISIE